MDFQYEKHLLELSRLEGRRDSEKQRFREVRRNHRDAKKRLEGLEKSESVFRLVAKETQEQFRFHLSHLVSLALANVFSEPYTFRIDFVEKRGKTECLLVFEKDGKTFEPLTASGGGAVDVASFALRLSLWRLSNNQSRPVFIFDEPFRFLSVDLQHKAGEMLKQLSDNLGVQVFLITHENEIEEVADKSFATIGKSGRTRINANQIQP